MKKRKKLIIAICIVAVVVLSLFLVMRNARLQAAEADSAVQTKTLTRMTLADTVDVTGTVESKNSQKVYSAVPTLAVKTVNVSVGDKVNAGDILSVLNTDSLEKQIEQSQATLDSAKSTARQSVNSNQMKYNNDVANLNNGQNTAINSAKSAMDSAKYSLDQTVIKFNAAHNAYLDAQKALEAANAGGDPAAIASAQAAYDMASQADATANSVASSANRAYENAKTQYQTALTTANQQIEADKQALSASKAAANTQAQQASLENLQLQLNQATITAPISGTVTTVNAVEGASSSGLLFTIEDTGGLQIATAIKEYDINSVMLGMNATVESDGTGEDIYQGTLKSIEPAAAQSASIAGSGSGSGAVQAGSDNDVKFNALIDVTSQNTRLKIGMNARVSIILNQKENVLAVPYDAVVTNAAGEKVVYALTEGKKGIEAFQEISVVTGMETDFYIEVSGKDLKEGMQIVSNPESIPSLKLKAQATASPAQS